MKPFDSSHHIKHKFDGEYELNEITSNDRNLESEKAHPKLFVGAKVDGNSISS